MGWTSDTSVCNAALGLLGAEGITSLEDDVSTTADLCRLFFPQARDAVLRSYPWNFAVRRRNAGAPLSSTDPRAPAYEWTYGFLLPTDTDNYCLRVLDTEDGEPYRVEGGVLVCNASSVRYKYIKRVTAISEWDDNAKESLATHLAMLLALPITKSNKMMESMAQLWSVMRGDSENIDTQEGTPEVIDSDEILNARY